MIKQVELVLEDNDSPVSNDAQLIAAAILTLQMSTINAVATVDELIEILFGEPVSGHDEIE